MAIVTERVPFRFIVTECCGTALCYVNPRLPNYCSECGKHIMPAVRGWVTMHDPNAILKVNSNGN